MPADISTLGWSAISWIEHYLVHGPGDVQGEEVELDDEFAAFILKAYRLNPKTGARNIRRAFLSRAKGRSKSGLAAFIACFEALGPCRFDHFAEVGEVSDWGYEYDEGEPVGAPLRYVEILNVATEEGQAGNTYDAIFYMLSPETCSQELLEDYGRIDAGMTRTILPNKRGFIEPVTASNDSKDGGKSTFIVADETHLWTPPANPKAVHKLGKMHQTMARNLLKRKVASGWMLETSTMYAAGEGSVAEGTHAYAERLAKKGKPDARLLFDHRQASMDWDLSKRSDVLAALKESYGPAAAWMDLPSIADAFLDDPEVTEADFRRFWLNQPVPLVVEVNELIFPTWPDRVAEAQSPTALGIAGDALGKWFSLGSATETSIAPVVMSGLLAARVSTSLRREFVAEVARIALEHNLPVAIQFKGPAWRLVDDLEALGARIVEAKLEDFAQSCGDLRDDLEAGTVTHPDSTDLNNAVAAAEWRTVNDRLVLSRKGGDVSMLEAVTLARWAAVTNATYDPMASIL